MKGRGVSKPERIVKLDSLKQINLNAAGLDIGAEEIYVAVPEDRGEMSVRKFPTFTADLYALADWLKACAVTTVAMESTGVYWIPVYEILEGRGFGVYLVNARQLKNVTGRKTDVLDCQWIQQLHTLRQAQGRLFGLLHGSFRPPEQVCALRSLVRHRDNLIRYRSAHVQHMQKALHQMNLLLTNVVKDITGLTGMSIIRAILDGERDPYELASYRNEHCAKSEAEIAKSLQGNYKPEHLFALQQAVELYDFYNQQIRNCDGEIERLYATFEPQVDIQEKPLSPRKRPRRKPQGNEPDFDLRTCLYQMAGVDLTRIDGLDVLLVQEILSETGVDMSRWPTVKHFTAWLRLSPDNDISGGKVLRTGTQKTKSRANRAFRLAARSLHHSDSALGAFYRRKRAQLGAPQAIVATAHKLARLVYFMLKNRTEYVDPGPDYYEQKYRERVVRNLRRKAHELGLELVPGGVQSAA
jgi:transposase